MKLSTGVSRNFAQRKTHATSRESEEMSHVSVRQKSSAWFCAIQNRRVTTIISISISYNSCVLPDKLWWCLVRTDVLFSFSHIFWPCLTRTEKKYLFFALYSRWCLTRTEVYNSFRFSFLVSKSTSSRVVYSIFCFEISFLRIVDHIFSENSKHCAMKLKTWRKTS